MSKNKEKLAYCPIHSVHLGRLKPSYILKPKFKGHPPRCSIPLRCSCCGSKKICDRLLITLNDFGYYSVACA